MNKTLFGTLLGTLLVAGCSSQPTPTENAAPVAQEPVQQIPGEFNRESLYELLRAEIAGQRRQFDLALEIYLEQARLTGDPAVAERATRIAQYLQRPDEMLIAARLWLESQPDNPEPYQLAAGLLLHQGDFEAALPLMEQAMAADSRQALALLSGQAGNMAPAELEGYIEMIGRQLAKTPNDGNLLLTRGQLLKQLDRTDEALADFDRALELNPDNLDAVMLKAELLRLSDRSREALALIRPYQQTLGDNRQVQVLHVQLLFQSDAMDAGVRAARNLTLRFPDDNQLHYYLALLMLENDRLNDSRRVLETLVENDPENTAPHFYLGYIAQTQGRNEQAIEHYGRVEEGPNLFQSYARTLSLLDRDEDRARIELVLEDARARFPELAARLYNLEAEWLNLHDQRDDALSLLDQAIDELGNDVALLYTRAMLIEPDNFAQMERDLRQVLELEPDNASALNALGYTLTIHTERYDEAYRLIAQALELKPDDPAILDSMGWILFKLERYPEAIRYLQQAYDSYPDPEVASHLIRAYWADGQQNRARELLEQHLSEDPQNEHLREAVNAVGMP
ncbi:tetratricopeptide repeat protein [Marinobacterium aestuariivivens]|uniref:Tetratricopeptide repeat protein n=1 Tax=Marinobacterium aestuariivivens TaxID=1698799 RepID=A0ABW2A1Q7_9GAMM